MTINIDYSPVAAIGKLAQMAGQADYNKAVAAEMRAKKHQEKMFLLEASLAMKRDQFAREFELEKFKTIKKFELDQSIIKQQTDMQVQIEKDIADFTRDEQKRQQEIDEFERKMKAIDDAQHLTPQEKEQMKLQVQTGVAPPKQEAPKTEFDYLPPALKIRVMQEQRQFQEQTNQLYGFKRWQRERDIREGRIKFEPSPETTLAIDYWSKYGSMPNEETAATTEPNWELKETEQGFVQVNPKTGEVRPVQGITPKPDTKTKQQKLETATVLRKEFNTAKVYEDYQIIQRSESGMEQAYRASTAGDPKTRMASDQTLAVLFQKMLDPTSVVRESEYARTPEGVSLINRMMSYIPQLQKGGLKITDEDRKSLIEMSRKLLYESKKSMNDHIDRYEKLCQLYEVEPEYVLGNIKRFELGMSPEEQQELEELEALEAQENAAY